MTAVAKATISVDIRKITTTASGPDRRGSGWTSSLLKADQVSHPIAAACANIHAARFMGFLEACGDGRAANAA